MLPNATVAAMMQKRREEEEGVRDSDEEEEGHLDDDRSGAISARRPKTPANRDDGLTTVMPSAPISSIDLKHLRDRLAYLTSPEEAYVVEKVLKDWRAEHRGKAKLLAAQDTVAGETVASPRSELQATRLTEWYRKEKGRKQLEKVKESLKKQGELKVNYLNLFGFMIFTALYMAILVLQKNPTTAFQIENSLIEATFSGDSGLLDANEELYPDVGAPSELFKWLRTAVVSTTFVDSSCGNGKCEAPDEFQGYEDFGCESDCGLYPNLTTVTIELTPDSNFAQTSWNIFAYHMGDDIFSAYKTLTSTDPYTYTASVPDGSYQFELRDTAGNGGAAGTLSVGGTEILSWPSSYPLQQYDHCDMRQWPSSWFTNIKQNCVSLCYLNNSNTQYTQPCDDMNTCTTACRNAVLAIKDRVLECTTEGFMHVDMDSLSSAYSVGTYAEQIYLFTQECFSENPFDPGTCTNEYCSNGPIGAQGCDVGCFTQQCDWKMDGCADLDTRSYGPTDDSDLLYDTSATGEGEEGEAGGPSPPVSNFDPMRYVNFVNFINSISDSVLIPSNDCNSPDGFGEVIEQIEEMTAGNKAYTFNVYNNWGGCTPYTSALTVPFDVYNYNANGTVLNLRDLSDSKVRYIGEKNRLLGGIFINQKRAKEVNCTTRFTSIDSTCVSDYEYDTEEYSVDPVFIGTSSLYDAFVSRSNFYSDQEISASGTPYAFFHSFVNPDGSIYTGIADTSNLSTTENPFGVNIHSSSASHSMSGFHAIFDNDLSQSQSSSYLQFLEDGFFLDEYTTELEVFYCTYNFEHGLLTTMKVMWYPEKGGRIKYRHIIQSIPFEPYRNTAGLVRLGLELVFVALLVFTIISELTDCIKAKKEGGSPLDYFKQVSNLFDIVSIIAMLAMCVLWIVIVLKVNSITLQTDFGVYRYQGENARPQTRYASTSLTKARFFEYDASNHAQFVTFISEISTLAGYNEAYVVLGGMNILLLVFRILKLMHFQARMGLLTRTLSHAATDLFHFIVLFMVTFVGFSFMSFILFGHQLREFMNMGESMLTCFEMIVGNYEVGRQLDYVGSSNFAGMVFYWAYFFVVFLILINILLAILVDSFADVKDNAQESNTMVNDMMEIFQSYKRGNAKSFMRDAKILKYITARLNELDGKTTAVDDDEKLKTNKVVPSDDPEDLTQAWTDKKDEPQTLDRTVDGDLFKQFLRPDSINPKGKLEHLLDDNLVDAITENVVARHDVVVEERAQFTAKDVLRLLEVEELFSSEEHDLPLGTTAKGKLLKGESSLKVSDAYAKRESASGPNPSLLLRRIEGLEGEMSTMRSFMHDMNKSLNQKLSIIAKGLKVEEDSVIGKPSLSEESFDGVKN